MLKCSFLLLMLSIMLASCASGTTETVEQIPVAKDKLTFIDFYSDECPNCMIMQPIVDRLADRYRDHLSLKALNVDAEGKSLFESLGLHSNPVFLIVKADGTVLYKGFGRVPELALDKAIQDAIGL
jgi:thiol-disulfide isomerase/thioredoxin